MYKGLQTIRLDNQLIAQMQSTTGDTVTYRDREIQLLAEARTLGVHPAVTVLPTEDQAMLSPCCRSHQTSRTTEQSPQTASHSSSSLPLSCASPESSTTFHRLSKSTSSSRIRSKSPKDVLPPPKKSSWWRPWNRSGASAFSSGFTHPLIRLPLLLIVFSLLGVELILYIILRSLLFWYATLTV